MWEIFRTGLFLTAFAVGSLLAKSQMQAMPENPPPIDSTDSLIVLCDGGRVSVIPLVSRAGPVNLDCVPSKMLVFRDELPAVQPYENNSLLIDRWLRSALAATLAW